MNRTNFRTTYYKTLGVPVVQHIVDVEASYHALFAESHINTTQLRKLAMEVGICPTFRATTWKILCGVLPTYTCLWEMAEHECQVMYEDVVDAVRVLQFQDTNEDEDDEDDPAAMDNSSLTPRDHQSARRMVRLYLSYRRDILCSPPFVVADSTKHAAYLDNIAMILQVVMPESPADQFWCFGRLVELLHQPLDDSAIDALHIPVNVSDEIAITEFEMLFVRSLEAAKPAVRPS